MIRLMKYKLFFFIISLLMILHGLFFLITSGLKLGIDFTGGALLEYQFTDKKFTEEQLKDQLRPYGVISPSENKTFIIRTKPLEHEQLQNLKKELENKFGKFEIRREENVGPVIGQELERKALIA